MNTITKKPKRNIVTFDPCGPVALMLANACKGKARGCKTKLIECAIAEACRKSQPKLYDAWKILKEHNAD